MLQIDNTIVSVRLLEEKFACNLASCNGCCCRYGDSGAPLTPEEVIILEEIWPEVRKFLRPEGITSVEEKGTSLTDFEGECVTPLINNEECAYALYENGVWLCGIERAWFSRKISFRKPISCHLFPLRVKNFTDFKAVNYEEWPLCRPALDEGKEKNIRLYKFLKEPLIRAFGNEWYKKLEFAAEEFDKQGGRLDDR
jgi:hypothetical protein